MKRSYDYSFVSGSPIKTNSPLPPRSFQQAATLAEQSPPVGIYSGHLLRSSYSQTHPIYHTPTESYKPPSPQPLIQPWYHTPIQPLCRPPLAGLGISLGTPHSDAHSPSLSIVQPVAFPLRLPLATFSTSGNVSSLRSLGFEDASFLPAVNTSTILRPYDSIPAVGLSPNPRILVTDDSAYSACPSNDYIAHSPVSDTAELMSWSPAATDCSDVEMQDDFLAALDFHTLTPYMKQQSSPTEPLIGLFADFNMREFALSQREVSFGINPAVLMMSTAPEDKVDSMISPGASLEPQHYDDPSSDTNMNFTEDNVDAIVSVLSRAIVEKEGEEEKAPSLPTPAVRSVVPTPLVHQYSNNQGLPVPALPTRSTTIPSTSSPKVSGFSPILKLASTPNSASLPSPLASCRVPLADITTSIVANRSAVFNAHMGIELQDLRARAEEFRAQNPGHDIDKIWLQSFAGKLSAGGERLQEFRCYVKNCTQMNKRRDHILVHVGSHVEFRPFQCDSCGMKFLRKNECKRHMSSHGGQKPYTCTICAPFQDKSFVRQDLLKRHIKVTHGARSGEQGRRKRIKLEKEIKEGNLIKFDSPTMSDVSQSPHEPDVC